MTGKCAFRFTLKRPPNSLTPASRFSHRFLFPFPKVSVRTPTSLPPSPPRKFPASGFPVLNSTEKIEEEVFFHLTMQNKFRLGSNILVESIDISRSKCAPEQTSKITKLQYPTTWKASWSMIIILERTWFVLFLIPLRSQALMQINTNVCYINRSGWVSLNSSTFSLRRCFQRIFSRVSSFSSQPWIIWINAMLFTQVYYAKQRKKKGNL